MSCFFFLLICGCSTGQPHAQKVNYKELRELESDNEISMKRLSIALQELYELRDISRSLPPLERQFFDSKLEKQHQRRLKDAQELRDKLDRYGYDIGDEKALYDMLR